MNVIFYILCGLGIVYCGLYGAYCASEKRTGDAISLGVMTMMGVAALVLLMTVA